MITLRSFVYGMALAIAVGVPLGVLMGRVKIVDKIFGLWVNMFVSAPLSALVPILMILFGLGETTVFVTVFLFAVWIIVLDARAGVMQVPPSLIEMGRCYGASRWTIFTKIVLLSALPEILAGIRIGLIRGVKGVVIGQILVSVIGYGELFELYSAKLRHGAFLGSYPHSVRGGDVVLRSGGTLRKTHRILRWSAIMNHMPHLTNYVFTPACPDHAGRRDRRALPRPSHLLRRPQLRRPCGRDGPRPEQGTAVLLPEKPRQRWAPGKFPYPARPRTFITRSN